MNHEQFIEKNVKQRLISEGYSIAICFGACLAAVNHYRSASQASKKGCMFDDCYRIAKKYAESNSTIADKKVKK